jgi:hypothetical protein
VAAIELAGAHEHGFAWIEAGRMMRASHALAREGQVWLVDPLDWEELDERVAALGAAAGVVQLLDRHERDCAAVAARLGVQHYVVPLARPAGLPFECIAVLRRRHWREAALWWPELRLLACADALGRAPYFLASGEELGVHPLLRLTPPQALRGLEPLHILCGHGPPLHGAAAAPALATALRTARRRAPAAWLNALRTGGR